MALIPPGRHLTDQLLDRPDASAQALLGQFHLGHVRLVDHHRRFAGKLLADSAVFCL